jgi:hypothetical protein
MRRVVCKVCVCNGKPDNVRRKFRPRNVPSSNNALSHRTTFRIFAYVNKPARGNTAEQTYGVNSVFVEGVQRRNVHRGGVVVAVNEMWCGVNGTATVKRLRRTMSTERYVQHRP